MSPSEATNQATRREWRELGFYYDRRDDPPRWRFVGSAAGLARFVALLDGYVREPINDLVSEHEHYGPYMYLKVETAESPAIDARSIRGSLDDLARLRDRIAGRLRGAVAGQSFVLEDDAAAGSHPLEFEVRDEDFDPASADPLLWERAR